MPAERAFLTDRSGPLRQFVDGLGAWTEGWRPVGPVAGRLRRRRPGSRADWIVAHGNIFEPPEFARLVLRRRPAGVAVAYCPRTHARFGHPPHPFRAMLDAGVVVCLGTDSLASSPTLSILDEVRFLHRHHPDVPGATLLRMATIHGAWALRMDAEDRQPRTGQVRRPAPCSRSTDAAQRDPHHRWLDDAARRWRRCSAAGSSRAVGRDSLSRFDDPDRLDRAFFQRGATGGFFLGRCWAASGRSYSPRVLADEVVGGDLAAEVAVDAGGVDEVAPADVLGDFLVEVGHDSATRRTVCGNATGGSLRQFRRAISDRLRVDPGHQAAEALADLLDGVLALAALGGEEAGLARLVFEDELAGELAGLDLLEDLPHLGPGVLGDDPGASGVVAVFGGVRDAVPHVVEAALIHQVDDQLQLVQALEVGDSGW